MEALQFSVHELPELAEHGAGFIVVAVCGEWRDGEAYDDAWQLPHKQRELRRRFMARVPANTDSVVRQPPA